MQLQGPQLMSSIRLYHSFLSTSRCTSKGCKHSHKSVVDSHQGPACAGIEPVVTLHNTATSQRSDSSCCLLASGTTTSAASFCDRDSARSVGFLLPQHSRGASLQGDPNSTSLG